MRACAAEQTRKWRAHLLFPRNPSRQSAIGATEDENPHFRSYAKIQNRASLPEKAKVGMAMFDRSDP